MTAINATRCDQAIKAARKNGKRKEEEIRNVQFSQAFHCTRQAHQVTPAECHDCFNTLEPSLRLATNDNRQRCIEMHTKKGRAMKKDEKSKAAPTPVKVEGEIEMKIKPGQIVAVVLEKGQEPVEIKVTKEMAADRHAALNYAENAVRNKSLAEIQLCVAVALYLGEGEHAPWVIDGFQSPREAAQTMFGWSDMKTSYRKRLGQAFINQYGKESVLKRSEELGISQIPHRKLREFLQAPKQFEQFLNTGRFFSVTGEEITLEQVLKKGIGQLSLLFDRFTEESGKKADTSKQPALPPPAKKRPSLSEKEGIISNTLMMLRLDLQRTLKNLIDRVEAWPENASALLHESPELQKEWKALDRIAGILTTTVLSTRFGTPEEILKAAHLDAGTLTIYQQLAVGVAEGDLRGAFGEPVEKDDLPLKPGEDKDGAHRIWDEN